jgi:hypothetical protein
VAGTPQALSNNLLKRENMEIKDEGVCRFCLKTFSGRGMGRHLIACQAKKQQDRQDAANGQSPVTIYQIRIRSYKPFWLHLEMQATATLDDLDSFLRDIWLECCGHLSQFRIDDRSYLVPMAMEHWWDPEAKSMDVQLQKVLRAKDSFEYEYDFGSTTYLEGQVYAVREGVLKDKVRILARNNMPELQCTDCGAEATDICVECWDLFCTKCLVDHEGGEEMTLPVVNSPRMGVCGFSGKYDLDDFKPPS